MKFGLIIPGEVWIESLFLWGPSLLFGGFSYLFIYYYFVNSAHYLTSKLVDVSLGRDSVYFTIDEIKVEKLINESRAVWIIFISTFLFLLSMFIFRAEKHIIILFTLPYDELNNFRILSLVISLVIISTALFFFSPNKKLKRRLSAILNKRIRMIQTDYEEVRKLKRIIPQIRKYASKLKVFFPVNYIPDAQKEIKKMNCLIFTDLFLTKKIISEKINLAFSDKNELEKADMLYSNFLKFYNKVNLNVLKTNSICHINQLNYLIGLMEENKAQLLTHRKWKDFESSINDFLLALDELNGLALRYISSNDGEDNISAKVANDPYVILEADKQMSNEEIRRRWKQLLEEFHPDKADNTTEGIRKLVTRKAQSINNAFNEIKQERNLR